jgi:hypothetical protein
VYDEFAAKLNPKLKPQEKDIKTIPNLIYSVISPLVVNI